MPRLTVKEDAAPEAAAKTSPTSAVVTDAQGRKITIRKLGPIERMRLAKLVGGENSANEVYMGYATLAFTVTDIAGDPVYPPANERELEALVGRLDDHGLEAVANGYVEHFGAPLPDGDTRAALKN
jgi:hypothetical protein